jgi:UV DNA damage repair endonuclease
VEVPVSGSWFSPLSSQLFPLVGNPRYQRSKVDSFVAQPLLPLGELVLSRDIFLLGLALEDS